MHQTAIFFVHAELKTVAIKAACAKLKITVLVCISETSRFVIFWIRNNIQGNGLSLN